VAASAPSFTLVLIDMESIVEVMELPADEHLAQEPADLRLLDKSDGNGTGAAFWRDCRFLAAVESPARGLDLAVSFEGVVPSSAIEKAEGMEGACLVYRELSRTAYEPGGIGR